MERNHTLSIFATLATVLIAVIWGTNYLAVKFAVQNISPFLLLFYRSLCAILVGLVIYKLLPQRFKTFGKFSFKSMVPGVVLFGAVAFQGFGLIYTSATKSAFVTSLYFVFVPLITFIFLKKKVSTQYLIGSFMAIIGLFFLFNPDFSEFSLGDGLSLMCAFLYGLQFFTVGVFANKINTFQLYFVQMTVICVLSFIISIVQGNFSVPSDIQVIQAIIFVGIFATAIAFFLQFWAQKYLSATRVSLILTLEPVTAAIFSFVFIGENLGIRGFSGCFFILSGLFIYEFAGIIFKKIRPSKETDEILESIYDELTEEEQVLRKYSLETKN